MTKKYRISKFIPVSTSRGKFERRNISELLPNFSTTCAAQLNEALQMQKEVHMRMSDQLEVFKKSQLCSIRIKADRNEIQSEEGFRAPKRLKVDEDVLSPSFRNASVNLESCSQAMFLQKEMQISYPDHGLSFPWSIAACPSPLVPSFF
uniref:Uncharacterized protein n=1 Tax=Quercus lobata TaxID=97700 RepID=A0A7N2M2P1_QUELO